MQEGHGLNPGATLFSTRKKENQRVDGIAQPGQGCGLISVTIAGDALPQQNRSGPFGAVFGLNLLYEHTNDYSRDIVNCKGAKTKPWRPSAYTALHVGQLHGLASGLTFLLCFFYSLELY